MHLEILSYFFSVYCIAILNEEVFLNGFRKAEMTNFNTLERDAYDLSLKRYRGLKGVIDTSFNERRSDWSRKGTANRTEKKRRFSCKKCSSKRKAIS